MQPLRKDHVDFYKSFCSKKIEDQEDSILTVIEINAQEQADRDFKNFPKLLKHFSFNLDTLFFSLKVSPNLILFS